MFFQGVTCDYDECTEELTLDPSRPAEMMEDAGWVIQHGNHYCPDHAKQYVSVAFVVELTPELRSQLSIVEYDYAPQVELHDGSMMALTVAAITGKGTFSIAEVGVPFWAHEAGAEPEEWV